MEIEWWKTAVIYQIYPRSFQDSNGDGIGDLNGIRRRLPYLSALGVDAVWVSPFYPSPMVDFGYDVADYCDVDPRFGTLADCQRLIAEAHALGLKVILDYVPNHTSDRHPWFIGAGRAGRARNATGTSGRMHGRRRTAQQLGEPFRRQRLGMGRGLRPVLLPRVLKEQPDLNWRNPEVRSAMHDVLRFWLDRGVDGFRVDVIGT